MTTGKLGCLGSPAFARCASFGVASLIAACRAVAPRGAKAGSSQTISSKNFRTQT